MLRRASILACPALVLAFACTGDKNNDNVNADSSGSGGVSGSATTTNAASSMTSTATTGGGATATATSSSSSSDSVSSTTGAGAATGSSTSAGGTSATSSVGSGGTGNPDAGLSCEPPAGEVPDLGFETVAGDFTEPVFVAQPPGDNQRLFVVEQIGVIKIVEDGSTLDTPFLDIGDQVSRNSLERGLFAVAFHPDYQENGLFYLHYSATAGTHDLNEGATVLSEFSVSNDPNLADAESERVVLTTSQPNVNHNGGMVGFGPDGYLYLGLGDGGGGGDPDRNGQDPDTWLGSILRLDVDSREIDDSYGAPEGNMPDGAPEIWDIGLRNPWRFSFDLCTGDLYIGDVGQNDWEEINVEPAGMGHRNYGWNVTEGLSCYNANSCESGGLTEPVIDYGRGEGSSVTGGYVYRGSEIPGLRGTYIYADYQSGTFWAFEYAEGSARNNRELTFDRQFQGSGMNAPGIASFGQDNAGELYVVVRNAGELLKLVAR